MEEVKKALRDPSFRKSLPEELQPDLQKYERNPSCPCNIPLYQKILKLGAKQLLLRYPNSEIEKFNMELIENHWSVINCHVNDLEKHLKRLPNGRKQLAIARYGSQVTVVVNELDYA